MNFQDIFDKCLPILKQYAVFFVVGGCGVIFIGYGLISSFSTQSADTTPQLIQPVTQSASFKTKKILIDIEGAVVRPGVYSLFQDDRVQDAIRASGGFSANADRIWVAERLNLATKLTDGAKIYIPAVGEAQTGAIDSGLAGSQDSLISINNAGKAELDALPGVGPVTAEKIIANRPYGALSELVSKKAVSTKVFNGIKDQIEL